MAQNPYEPAHAVSPTPQQPRPGRRLVWAGVALLAVAAIGVLISVLGMMLAFDTVARSNSVNPSGLAQGIKWATIPSLAALPLGVAGIVLIVVGIVRRRRGA